MPKPTILNRNHHKIERTIRDATRESIFCGDGAFQQEIENAREVIKHDAIRQIIDRAAYAVIRCEAIRIIAIAKEPKKEGRKT